MAEAPQSPVTMMLKAASLGDRAAAEKLLPLVYDELRQLAKARLARTPPGNTLQPTALVHEAYMRLVGGTQESDPGWDSRGHFFGAAARAMRDILVEQARRKSRRKAGGDRKRVGFDDEQVAATPDAADAPSPGASIEEPVEDMLALDAALIELEKQDPRKAEVVMLKYFAGLNHEQIAGALGCSVPTVERDWRFARTWLQQQLQPGDTSS